VTARERVRGVPREAKAGGGKTSVRDCVLLCFFHHQVMIHWMGWTLVLNPDGTTTAWNLGRTEVSATPGSIAAPFAIAA
jgi:hypothetical protein